MHFDDNMCTLINYINFYIFLIVVQNRTWSTKILISSTLLFEAASNSKILKGRFVKMIRMMYIHYKGSKSLPGFRSL